MTTPLTPEGARSWFNTLYGFTERSTPITMVFILIAGVTFGWYMLGEIRRTRGITLQLHQDLIAAKDAQIALILKCRGLE